MAKSNHSFQKRKRQLDKQKKREDKLQKKLDKRDHTPATFDEMIADPNSLQPDGIEVEGLVNDSEEESDEKEK